MKLPVEVQLAWEVMTCKAMRETYDDAKQPCRYFNRHFGPALAFDWVEGNLNVGMKPSDGHIFARTNGSRFSVPALSGGCRKAPIMTVGINPNMPSWLMLNAEGSRWCYPYFDDIAEYAAYYRYQTVFQEKFPIELIRNHIDLSKALIAPKAGITKGVKHTVDGQGIELTVTYDGDAAPTIIVVPREFVVITDKNQKFKTGDSLAGPVDMTVGEETLISQETVGYYQLFANILDLTERKLVLLGKIPADTDLHAGEDVLLGDMVACASPGWTAQDGGVPEEYRKGIASSCCKDRGWLALQYQQTSPAIVVFSGTSAFNMFRQAFNGISFSPPLPDNLSGPYAWLRFTLNNRVIMSVKDGAAPTRIIVAPHFSYKVNFTSCYAFTIAEWEDFKNKWPDQSKLLNGEPYSGQVLISLKNPIASKDNMGSAWSDLKKQLIEPYDMIATIIVNEFENGTISFDEKNKHLARTAGPCQFCSNQLFVIKEKCPYGKDSILAERSLPGRVYAAAKSMIEG